tara:strand:+ start:1410 stop:1610 length:201 start_codon:yes stop_codon:yes gene_type:complete
MDKVVIKDMLDKVILGTQSHEQLVEVFTAMAEALGVKKDPVPAPAPTPEPVSEGEDGDEKRSFFGG